MRTVLTKSSNKEVSKCGVTDDNLVKAITRANTGLLDNRIGSLLIKQEIDRPGEGRKTACRAIVAFNFGAISVILHVYEKSKKANITKAEKKIFEDNASSFLQLTDEAINELIAKHGWREVHDGKQKEVGKGENLQE